MDLNHKLSGTIWCIELKRSSYAEKWYQDNFYCTNKIKMFEQHRMKTSAGEHADKKVPYCCKLGLHRAGIAALIQCAQYPFLKGFHKWCGKKKISNQLVRHLNVHSLHMECCGQWKDETKGYLQLVSSLQNSTNTTTMFSKYSRVRLWTVTHKWLFSHLILS